MSTSSSGRLSRDRHRPAQCAPGRLPPVALVKVLVVDDEPVSALMAAAIVRRLGHEVTTASDGDDAWRHLQAGDFAVVISDRDMPVVGGLELCRRLRQEGLAGLDGPVGTGGAGQVRYTYLIPVSYTHLTLPTKRIV